MNKDLLKVIRRSSKFDTLSSQLILMTLHFNKRTSMHIDLVKKYAKLLEEKQLEYIDSNYSSTRMPLTGLTEIAEKHDESKYKEPELIPYLFISWDYKCKQEKIPYSIPVYMKEECSKASEHHVTTNKHHPEYWSSEKTGVINREDRDKKPSKIIDATKMPLIYVAEMVCDWLAMSEELGTSVREWVMKNINIRWKFTQEQTGFIYQLIELSED